MSHVSSRAASDCNNGKSLLYCSNSQLLVDDENQKFIDQLDIRQDTQADEVSLFESSSDDSY